MALVTVSLMSYPGFAAADPAEVAGQVTGSEGGRAAAKEAINGALKFAKSKPAMTTATGIVCLACIPVAGASASAGMFLLIQKA